MAEQSHLKNRSWKIWRVLGILAAVGVPVALGLTMGACGSSSDTGTGGGQESVVVFGTNLQPYVSLDPALEPMTSMSQFNVNERLADWDGNTGKLVPVLATSWEGSPDGKTWTFHLREGVKFADGTPFNSEAVKFCVERYQEKQQGAAFIWDNVESIDTPDDYTVVFNCSKPTPLNLIAATCTTAQMYSPTAVKTLGESKAFQPPSKVGTGPWMIKSSSTTEVQMVRNPNYWGGWEDEYANAPTIAIIRQISEPAARVQSVTTHDVQAVSEIPVESVPDLQTNPAVKVVIAPSWLNQYIFLNTKKKPTDDVHLREALWYAFPYQQVLDLVFGGYGTVATGIIPRGVPGSAEQEALLGTPQQDLNRARAALAKSAYPDGGVKVVFAVDEGANAMIKIAQLFQSAAAKLNIDMQVAIRSADQNWTAFYDKNPPQHLYISTWAPPYPSGVSLALQLLTGTPLDLSYWSSPKTTAEINQSSYLLAQGKDQAAYDLLAQAQKEVQSQYVIITPVDQKEPILEDSRLQGLDRFGPIDIYTFPFRNVSLSQ